MQNKCVSQQSRLVRVMDVLAIVAGIVTLFYYCCCCCALGLFLGAIICKVFIDVVVVFNFIGRICTHLKMLQTLYENKYISYENTHSHKYGTVLRVIGVTGKSAKLYQNSAIFCASLALYVSVCVYMSMNLWMSECVLEFGRRTTFTHTTQEWMD